MYTYVNHVICLKQIQCYKSIISQYIWEKINPQISVIKGQILTPQPHILLRERNCYLWSCAVNTISLSFCKQTCQFLLVNKEQNTQDWEEAINDTFRFIIIPLLCHSSEPHVGTRAASAYSGSVGSSSFQFDFIVLMWTWSLSLESPFCPFPLAIYQTCNPPYSWTLLREYFFRTSSFIKLVWMPPG